MIRYIGFIATLAACQAAWSAPAIEVTDLFHGVVPVESDSENARQRAARAALAQVMVRVSGDPMIAERSGAEVLMRQASAFLQQFRYRRDDEGPIPRLLMGANFDPAEVTAAMKRYGLPVWPERRAVTLVYFAVADEAGGRRLLDRAQAQLEYPEIFEVAAARGTPLAFPLYDIEDETAIDVADIWGEFVGRVQQASARYDVHHMALLRLQQDGAQWISRLTWLTNRGETRRWSFASPGPAQALSASYSAYADALAERYVVRSGEGWLQDIEMQVAGISDLRTHGRVLEHLKSLGAVETVRLVEVAPGHNVFFIRFEGDLSGLERAIALGRILDPAEALAPVVAPSMSVFTLATRPRLHYRVLP